MLLQVSLDINKMKSPLKKVTREERINAAWISAVQDIFPRASPLSSSDLVRHNRRQNCRAASSVMSWSHGNDSRNWTSVYQSPETRAVTARGSSNNRGANSQDANEWTAEGPRHRSSKTRILDWTLLLTFSTTLRKLYPLWPWSKGHLFGLCKQRQHNSFWVKWLPTTRVSTCWFF